MSATLAAAVFALLGVIVGATSQPLGTAFWTDGDLRLFLLDILEALRPFPTAVQAADRTDIACVVAALDLDRFTVDQAVGDFFACRK